MSTGTLPFQGATSAPSSTRSLTNSLCRRDRCGAVSPRSWKEIISKALEKSRELRCQSAAEVNADLKRMRRELELRYEQQERPSPHRQPVYSRRAVWAVAISLAVLFAGYLSAKGSQETRLVRFPQRDSFSSPPQKSSRVSGLGA